MKKKSIMHCSDRKICFVFNWNMILKALFKKNFMYDAFLGHSHDVCILAYAGESLSFKLLPNFSQQKEEKKKKWLSGGKVFHFIFLTKS